MTEPVTTAQVIVVLSLALAVTSIGIVLLVPVQSLLTRLRRQERTGDNSKGEELQYGFDHFNHVHRPTQNRRRL
jgi:hypothetical protein